MVEKLNKGSKKPFIKRVLGFIGDKGFYIVLFLCVAVIGITAWVLSSTLNNTGLVDVPVLNATVSLSPSQQSALPSMEAVIPPSAPPKDTPKPAVGHSEVKPPENTENPETAQPTASAEPAVAAMNEAPVAAQLEGEEEPAAQHFMWPLSGTVETPHSVDSLIYDKTMADWRTHSGMDIAASLGTKVMAASDGTVDRVYDDDMYGTTVIIRHSGGLSSIYSNLAARPTVVEGDAVKIGDVIGAVGDTALAEAGDVTHLHFGMTLDDTAIDPGWYLPKR